MEDSLFVPNLMVTNLPRSVRFYTQVLGFELKMSLDDAQAFAAGDLLPNAVLAMITHGEHELMLQTNADMAKEFPQLFAPDQRPGRWGGIYVRGVDPRDMRIPEEYILRPVTQTWYGMIELHVRDPDGHLLVLAVPAGPTPS